MWMSNRGLVLLYHRIAETRSDPQLLAVSPRHFAQHLEVLREYGQPMAIGAMTAALQDRRLPSRPIAVTFDDGYADNLDCGKPLLERYETPATVFVTTSYAGHDREFWWDDLERLLLLPGRLPETLRIRIGSTIHEWRLGESSEYGIEDYERHSDWHVEHAHDPSSRHTVYRALCRLLRDVSGAERTSVLDELTDLAGATPTGRATHRALSLEGLGQLAEGDLVDVGAHTNSHSTLSAFSVAAQRSEIVESKARLQEITRRAVTGFAYPFGGHADYTPTTVGLVRDAGFALACANVPGLVRRRTDPFQLPRVLVRNWDAETFAGRLREWLGD